MSRKAIVSIIVLAALGVMVWAGYRNYQARKQQAAMAHAPVLTLVPDGQAAPATAGDTASSANAMDAMPEPLKGKAAPKFTLVDLNGKKVSLSDYKGKPVLLNFWATWCGPCKIEIPWIETLRDKYKDQGFEVLGIESDNYDTDPKALAEYKAGVVKSATALGINYPVLLEGDTLSQAYGGLDGLPNSFYVDRNGIVTAQIVGLRDRDEIEANIKKAIASGAAPASTGGQ
jgi:thiol-disulfide isomerase/thioredoxin